MSLSKKQFIKDMRAGEEVNGLFLLASAQLLQARNGPFWRLELQDGSGSQEAKIWSPQSQAYPELAAGMFVEIAGRASLYRERLDVVIDHLRILGDEESAELDLSEFLPSAPRKPEEMHAELVELVRSVLVHPPLRKMILGILQDEELQPKLLVAAGAKSVHHAYCGGLLQHILAVCNLCMSIADRYPKLDRQILLAGAVCHDIGKLWEISSGLVPDYTDSGRMLGHIQLGLQIIEPFMAKSGLEPELGMHLRHLVLSHHGLAEYGSPKPPMTAEALVLHHADNIDAKLAQFEEALDSAAVEPGRWSPYQKFLDRYLYAPIVTPTDPAGRSRKKSGGKETQCSLLSKE